MIGILGTGRAMGSKLLSNEELCQTLPVTPEWIVEKTGIKQRYMAVDGETVASLALQAARKALDAAQVSPEQIGLTIVATFSHDYLFPAASAKLHHDLGLKGGQFFDLQANCSGFVAALGVATDRMTVDPTVHYALVVGSEVVADFIDKTDENTAPFFSDGAGAVVLGPADVGFVANAYYADSSEYEAVRCKRGTAFPHIEQYGFATGKQALAHLPRTVLRALDKAHWDVADVDCFIFHQANLRLIEFLCGILHVQMTKTYTNVETVGNAGAASVPIALADAVEAGAIKSGSKVCFAAVGAGFGFGASCWIMP
jgi:3-oxoacyl-[acyl-carrier-protein] synthase-3